MTIYVPFAPSAGASRFYLTLGQVYSIVVKWNVSAQRYYFDLYDSAGTWVVTQPLVETAPSVQIISWRYLPDMKAMQFTGVTPKWRPLGQLVDGTIEGVDPPSLNGVWRYAVISPSDRIFPLAQDPGRVVQLGSVNHYENLIKGYIDGWSLIFRNSTFEINPISGA